LVSYHPPQYAFDHLVTDAVVRDRHNVHTEITSGKRLIDVYSRSQHSIFAVLNTSLSSFPIE